MDLVTWEQNLTSVSKWQEGPIFLKRKIKSKFTESKKNTFMMSKKSLTPNSKDTYKKNFCNLQLKNTLHKENSGSMCLRGVFFLYCLNDYYKLVSLLLLL